MRWEQKHITVFKNIPEMQKNIYIHCPPHSFFILKVWDGILWFPSLFPELLTLLSNFLLSISTWMSNRLLKLNMTQTKASSPLKCDYPLVFCISANDKSILPLLKTKPLMSSLNPLFFKYPTFNLSVNVVSTACKIYPEPDYFSPPLCHHPSLSPHAFSLNYYLIFLSGTLFFFALSLPPYSLLPTLYSEYSVKMLSRILWLLCFKVSQSASESLPYPTGLYKI